MRGSPGGRRCRGFGIIEMLIAMGLSVIVMAAATKFFSYQVSAMRTERVRRGAQMTARTALNFMVRNLELLGRDPQRVLFTSLDTPALPPAIATASASDIHYRTNLSEDLADADTLDEWEDVTFSVSDGVIWVTRGVAAPLPLTDGQAHADHPIRRGEFPEEQGQYRRCLSGGSPAPPVANHRQGDERTGP